MKNKQYNSINNTKITLVYGRIKTLNLEYNIILPFLLIIVLLVDHPNPFLMRTTSLEHML